MYNSIFEHLPNENIKPGDEYYTVEITGNVRDCDPISVKEDYSKSDFEDDICIIISYLLSNCMEKPIYEIFSDDFSFDNIFLHYDDGDSPITDFEMIKFPMYPGHYDYCHTLWDIEVTYHCTDGDFIIDNNDIIKKVSCERIVILKG